MQFFNLDGFGKINNSSFHIYENQPAVFLTYPTIYFDPDVSNLNFIPELNIWHAVELPFLISIMVLC